MIRAARPEEAGALSALALRSKAYWGYDEEFLAACREALTIDPAWCDGVRVLVAERDGAVVGFCRVAEAELAELFVDPVAIGQGVGGQLLRAALATARELGMPKLALDSDPHAEAFYLHEGAVRVGESFSTATGRMLPRLELAVPR